MRDLRDDLDPDFLPSGSSFYLEMKKEAGSPSAWAPGGGTPYRRGVAAAPPGMDSHQAGLIAEQAYVDAEQKARLPGAAVGGAMGAAAGAGGGFAAGRALRAARPAGGALMGAATGLLSGAALGMVLHAQREGREASDRTVAEIRALHKQAMGNLGIGSPMSGGLGKNLTPSLFRSPSASQSLKPPMPSMGGMPKTAGALDCYGPDGTELWSDKFVDTPFEGTARQLEQEVLQFDMQHDEAREQRQEESEAHYRQEDSYRRQRMMLEKQLKMHKLQASMPQQPEQQPPGELQAQPAPAEAPQQQAPPQAPAQEQVKEAMVAGGAGMGAGQFTRNSSPGEKATIVGGMAGGAGLGAGLGQYARHRATQDAKRYIGETRSSAAKSLLEAKKQMRSAGAGRDVGRGMVGDAARQVRQANPIRGAAGQRHLANTRGMFLDSWAQKGSGALRRSGAWLARNRGIAGSLGAVGGLGAAIGGVALHRRLKKEAESRRHGVHKDHLLHQLAGWATIAGGAAGVEGAARRAGRAADKARKAEIHRTLGMAGISDIRMANAIKKLNPREVARAFADKIRKNKEYGAALRMPKGMEVVRKARFGKPGAVGGALGAGAVLGSYGLGRLLLDKRGLKKEATLRPFGRSRCARRPCPRRPSASPSAQV